MNYCVRVFVLFIVSLCWAGLCLKAQPAQLDFRHYNTDDGLPSSECYTIVEDRTGYIWIGTDNGVARFDGYEFEVFDADDGLEDMVVFGIEEDRNGRIWISTFSGRIYFFENGTFHPFAHNNILEDIKRTKHLGVLVDVTDKDELILSFKNAGFLRVSSTGEVKWLTNFENRHIYLYRSIDEGKLTSASRPHGFFHPLGVSVLGRTSLYVLQGSELRSVKAVKHDEIRLGRSGFSGMFRTSYGQNESVVTTRRRFIILDSNWDTKHMYTISSNHFNYFMPGFYPDTYWAFLVRGGGLEGYDFREGGSRPKISHQLVGHSLSSGIRDRNGGFWITSIDDGIFYCPYPKQLIYRKEENAKNDKAISIALTGPGNYYVGYDDGGFFHYDEKTALFRQVQEEELFVSDRLFDLYFDPVKSRVLTPYYSFKHPVPAGKRLKAEMVNKFDYFRAGIKVPFGFRRFNEIKGENSRKLYGSNISSVAAIDLDTDEISLLKSYTKELPGSAHVLGELPDGTRLIGTLLGLMELKDDGTIVSNNLGVPELSKRVEFIKDIGDDKRLFGTRGDGVVFMSSDTTYLIRESDGLASDMIRDIHLSETGIIWISTLNGLSRLEISPGGKHYQVRTFRMEHGLPSNEVYQADTYGDELWLATSAGVVKFVQPEIVKESISPVIRSVLLNGVELPDTSSYTFPPGSQDVSISFGTINFVLEDKVLYRYRFSEVTPWKYSRERTVNYPNLGPGTYQFSVESKNQDGIWSASTIRSFTVATPWYGTVWASIGGVLLLAGMLTGFFLLRERRRKREQDLLVQITQLEHAALHAQMNPHFVFNALNSIQNFVLENDAKQAATYLSRFARVIRQTLRSSVDGQHRLNEELMMLETYLGLEKLRFKQGFSYTVEVDPILPKRKVILPPLLIQPFVENAIIHGLKDRKRGGRILLRFTGTADNLIVIIEDNGKGYDPGEEIKPDSLGMNITRRRLDMMNKGKDGVSGMEITPLFSDDGTPIGTRVTLFIRPLTDTAPAVAP